jgi:hypothetical protein
LSNSRRFVIPVVIPGCLGFQTLQISDHAHWRISGSRIQTDRKVERKMKKTVEKRASLKLIFPSLTRCLTLFWSLQDFSGAGASRELFQKNPAFS